MKKMLFSLIVISILGTGTALAQRRSSHSVQGGHRETVRTEACRNYGRGHHTTYVREYNYGHRGPVHHNYVHHRPYRPVHHCPPPRPVYRERVIVTPAPVAYSYPVPAPVPVPVPATTVVVETAPVHPAISIGALAGALIGGSIAAAACR